MEFAKKDLKITYAYTVFKSVVYGDVEALNESYISNLNKAGFDVNGFCLTLNPPNHALTFKELDRKWKRRDPTLLKMYEQLEKAIDGKDVLINASGVNLHPEFVESLPVFTVFQCFDDPESSEHLSKPAAFAYDLSLVGNIAEVDTYKSWGVKNVEWTCLGLMLDIFDTSITYESILNGERDINLFMMIDKTAPWRRERLNKIDCAFPTAHFYGKGWKRGILPISKEAEMLKRTKVGPNIHNSTGPINLRTFYLPANGVLQICDNKSHLGKLFDLNKEVIGFDTIEECIELCRYYLEHDDERRVIAANGWKRVMADYTQEKVFDRTYRLIESYLTQKTNSTAGKQVPEIVSRKRPVISRVVAFHEDLFAGCVSWLRKNARSVKRALLKITRPVNDSVIQDRTFRKILNHTDADYIENDRLAVMLSNDTYSLSQVLLGIDYFRSRISAVLRGGDVLVDVGCGAGHWSIAGSSFYKKSYAFDFNKQKIDLASQIASILKPRGEIIFDTVKIDKIPLKSKTADALLCIKTLNTVPVEEQSNLLAELRRIAKDKAILYLVVHDVGFIAWLGYSAVISRDFAKTKEWFKIIYRNALYFFGLRKHSSGFTHKRTLQIALQKVGWKIIYEGPEGDKSSRLVKPAFKKSFLGLPLIKEYVITPVIEHQVPSNVPKHENLSTPV